MEHTSDAHFYGIPKTAYLRNMLFRSRFCGVWNQLFHFFTAAEHGYAAGLEMEDNVAAMAASVDFQFHIKVF